MKRVLGISLCAALALCAAAPAFASFRIRLPRRAAGPRGVQRSNAPSRPAPVFPEGTLVSSYAIPESDAVFALYWSGLHPDAALKSAARALAAEGWTQVSVFGAVALFENSSGNCAAVQAIPANGGATAVSFLVGR